jgi:putative nucleotidyltransferase with HDIG domain
MRLQASLYIALCTSVAAAVLFALPDVYWTTIVRDDLWGLFAFAGLGMLSQIAAVGFTVSGKQEARSSIIFLPFLACALIFSPAATALVVVSVQLFSEFFLLKPRIWWRTVFNTSQYVIAYTLPAWAYQVLVGSGVDRTEINLPAFGAMALSAHLLNHFVIAGFVSLRQRVSYRSTVRLLAGPRGANIFFDILISPTAIFAALVYVHMGAHVLLLFVFPLVLVRLSYQNTAKLAHAIDDLLTVLVKTIEMRDAYTSGHSLRVASLARRIAEDLGLPPRQVDKIEQAALLHDVGKVDPIYSPLISKSFELSDSERDVIRTHASKGAELLSALSSVPQEVISAVRHHHERFDGTGYPDGLVGDAIPLASRIIMMADSIDAMLSDRPYRGAMSVLQVRDELVRGAGTQFDPGIASAVLARNTLERAADLALHSPNQEGGLGVAVPLSG